MPPSAADPKDPRAWLRRAKSNLALASIEPADPAILYDDLCFDAQQAAEKAIKAVLVARKRDFPKIHDVGRLLDLVSQAGLTVPDDVRLASRLTPYAVTGRYADALEEVTEAEWREAVALAEHVVRWAVAAIEGE